MASRWRKIETRRRSTWRQSLLFNSLILLLPVLGAQIVWDAYTTNAITDPTSIEARTETRSEIERAFSEIDLGSNDLRKAWAARIDRTVEERQFSAARGYLLAAPQMLNERDARAIQAAAAAESFGSEDQRLARAALLFLPDNVRANYQRATEPPRIEIVQPVAEDAAPAADAPEDTNTPPETEAAAQDAPTELAGQAIEDPIAGRRNFSVLGDETDLVRRSERWLANEPVDDLQLRLRALGLIALNAGNEQSEDIARGASILRAAKRSGRLNDRFAGYISGRIDDALPLDQLQNNLGATFETVLPTSQRVEGVLNAYQAAIDADAYARVNRDMIIIAQLADKTSAQGAISLVEQVASPDDMRRVLLIAEAGGDRSVALSRELGPNMLRLAQIGVKWTTSLVLQVMALMALGMALIWTTLSAFTQADPVRLNRY